MPPMYQYPNPMKDLAPAHGVPARSLCPDSRNAEFHVAIAVGLLPLWPSVRS